MPTVSVQLTSAAPVDIKAALSLVVGIAYSVQARGGNVQLTEQTSAPTIGTTPAHLLANDGPSGAYTPNATEALWAWAEFRSCAIVVTES